MPDLPTGTITFLFTDVEGSTQLWEEHPQAMRGVMARHDALLTAVFEQYDGIVVRPRGEGDSLFVVFVRASDAVAGALAGQYALCAEDWGAIGPLRVRMGLHTGEADLREGDYYGSAVNRCARIRAAGHGGQILLSQTTAALVRAGLAMGASLRPLGAHRLRDLRQPETIFQLEAPDLAADFPPLRTLESHPNNLPLSLTSFIGREQEVADIVRLLGDTRLLTLTGPGGSGKTRLALQVAAEVLDEFLDGVFFVDLAPLGDPALVPTAIAAALRVREVPDQPLTETLAAFLRPRTPLVVLDNFEHLTPAAPIISLLLSACAGVKALVTSRVPLHLSGERQYPVPPLALPSGAAPDSATVAQSPAVALFVARARDVRPDFVLTAENAAAVAAICARLDGLPLAIELAAARTKVLSPQALLGRLEQRLPLLAGGPRDAPARQQTLRAAIAWSQSLLEPAEQVLFRRVAVFAGGCTPEAAEAVCGDEEADGALPPPAVFDALASLVDKNLLLQGESSDGEPRFSMLETIREHAREQLEASGEAEAVRQRHAAHFAASAEKLESQLPSGHRDAWFAWLQIELHNLRAALDWAGARGDAELGSRLIGMLYWYWHTRGQVAEGLHWSSWLLALPAAAVRTPARAIGLFVAAALAIVQGHDRQPLQRARLEESVTLLRQAGEQRWLAAALRELGAQQTDFAISCSLLEESLALCRTAGDTWGAALTVMQLGMAAQDVGRVTEARTHFEESLTLFRQLDDTGSAGLCLTCLGEIALGQDDYAVASGFFERSLAAFRAVGERRRATRVLPYLGRIALRQGDAARATAFFDEAVAISRELGLHADAARHLTIQGAALASRGDYSRAAQLLSEALTVFREAGDPAGVGGCLQGLAGICSARHEEERAARLYGAAEVVLEATGWQVSPTYRGAYSRTIATLRARLGDVTFAMAWERGRMLSPALTIADALAVAGPASSSLASPQEGIGGVGGGEHSGEVWAPRGPGGLTAREVEVLRLIATGRSSREIAADLVISEATVTRHVTNLYSKIGVRNRAEATRYAHSHGLVESPRG